MRSRALTAAALAALALTLTAPSVALAQGTDTSSPFSPGIPAAPVTSPTTTAQTAITSTSTSGGGLSGADAVAIAIGALVILGGISLFIWYDARRRAPVRRRAAMATAGEGARTGSKQRAKPRKLSPAERRRRKRGRAR